MSTRSDMGYPPRSRFAPLFIIAWMGFFMFFIYVMIRYDREYVVAHPGWTATVSCPGEEPRVFESKDPPRMEGGALGIGKRISTSTWSRYVTLEPGCRVDISEMGPEAKP